MVFFEKMSLTLGHQMCRWLSVDAIIPLLSCDGSHQEELSSPPYDEVLTM